MSCLARRLRGGKLCGKVFGGQGPDAEEGNRHYTNRDGRHKVGDNQWKGDLLPGSWKNLFLRRHVGGTERFASERMHWCFLRGKLGLG